MYLFILLLALLVAPLNATESRLVDNAIKFPICEYGGEYFWDQNKIDDFTLKFPTTTLTNIQPTEMEILVSTTIKKFDNYSDFVSCVNDNAYYLRKKARQDLGL